MLVSSFVFCFLRKKMGFLRFLGTPMVVSNSSPRASMVVSVRIPQMLMLADGRFFPPGCCVVPWGRARAPAGVAPKALLERGCSCKVFSQCLPVCEVLVSAGVGNVSAGLGGVMRTYLTYVRVWCISKRCSHASSPRAWAQLRRSRGALCLVYTRLRRPSSGQRGEVSTTPIERVAKCGFLIEMLSGDSSGRPCPVQ
jgi:hypothetical protein